MSKKHFIQIAKTIEARFVIESAHPHPGGTAAAVRDIARDLAADFASFNPNFDRARFLAACGVEAR